MHLRDDQRTFLNQIDRAIETAPHSVLAVAPTGSGKTVCFSMLTKSWAEEGRRVMILVHRAELLAQVSSTLTTLGVEHGVIAPSFPNHKNRQVQVASVQTLVHRLADHAPPDYLIIDEAHHAIAKSSWGKVFLAWPHAKRLGVTATPERLSGEGLRDTFSTMVMGPSVSALMEQGALSPYRLFAPPIAALGTVHRRMGDYVRGELETAMNTRTITGNAVKHYQSLAAGKRAMVFCVSIRHAEAVAEEFLAAGVVAESLDGTMRDHERKAILQRFTAGHSKVLTSCDLVSEGFDLPAVEVAILLRPTESLGLYLQQVGRALRPYPGKDAALILDHAGNTMKHGLPDEARDWSLDGKDARTASLADRAVATKLCPICYAVVLEGVSVCPECHHAFMASARTIVQVEGTLEEVDLLRVRQQRKAEQGRAVSLDDLVALGTARGYKQPKYWAQQIVWARQGR